MAHVIASGSFDRTMRLWDAATGSPVGTPNTDRVAGVLALAFSPDGKRLASVETDMVLQWWDPASGKKVGNPSASHISTLLGAAFDPDVHRVAFARADRTVSISMRRRASRWSTTHGPHRTRQRSGLQSRREALGVGRRRCDGAVVGSGHARRGPPRPGGHAGPVDAVAFSPDESFSPPAAATEPFASGIRRRATRAFSP